MESVYVVTIRGYDGCGSWDKIHGVFQSKDAAIKEVVKLVADLSSSWYKKEEREQELAFCAEELKSYGIYNYLINEKNHYKGNWREFEIVDCVVKQ